MNNLKQQIIDYRNNHKESRVLLGVILGEFERKEKEKDRTIGEITDEEALIIIKKLISGNILCGQAPDSEENKILELFIPKQLTEEQIENIIKREHFTSIKDCMGFFKELYTGLYNGQLVSKIYKEYENI